MTWRHPVCMYPRPWVLDRDANKILKIASKHCHAIHVVYSINPIGLHLYSLPLQKKAIHDRSLLPEAYKDKSPTWYIHRPNICLHRFFCTWIREWMGNCWISPIKGMMYLHQCKFVTMFFSNEHYNKRHARCRPTVSGLTRFFHYIECSKKWHNF
mgnify:CR=1 FL=1